MEFEFIADRPVLDFLPTVAERGTTDEEKLATPEDLLAWARQSGLVHDLTAVTSAQLAAAKELREAAFGLVAAMIDDTAPAPADRAVVNRDAARRRPVLQLDEDGRVRRTGGFEALLAALAYDCLDLHASPDRAALSWCADSRCTRPYIDRSRGRRRRWCGMAGCGDRAKAAAYRARQRARA